jgi:UDP-4-amino-4,6-dideoxy-N-acetyl-beta-L-altrosamine transaminase
MAVGLRPGDRLWTVPNTFVASANCGRYCGAEIDFVDIEPDTWNMSVSRLEEKLIEAERTARLPKVVVPVHFSGQPTEQEAISRLAQRYGFSIVEDASHSIGASRRSERVGNCRWSDITVFSFHPVKIITSGEGGMAVTNDEILAEKMRMLRSHGITRDVTKFKSVDSVAQGSGGEIPPAWQYEQQLLGFNYRMTDIHAALGVSQLERLPQYVARRNYLASRYDSRLRRTELQLPVVRPENRSAYHIYVVRLRPDKVRVSRRQVFDRMRARGIGVNVHYTPVHLQPYYRDLGFEVGNYPESEAYGEEAITLPLYYGLTDSMQDQVIDALHQSLSDD